MEKKKMSVRLLGEFILKYKHREYMLSICLSYQTQIIFQFLLVRYNEIVYEDEVERILWANDDALHQPLSSLIEQLNKTMMSFLPIEDENIIIEDKGGYILNPYYQWDIDIVEFNKAYDKAIRNSRMSDDIKKSEYKLIKLYIGKFFCVEGNPWSALQRTIYREKFINCVMNMCHKLDVKKDYNELLEVCHKAILVEPLFEGFHYYTRIFAKTKDYHKGLEYFDDYNEALYNELGNNLSGETEELYEQLIKNQDFGDKVSLKSLAKELSLSQNRTGGFECTYDLFKYVLEAMVKDAKRYHKKYYLLLLNVNHIHQAKDNCGLESLNHHISRFLRANDIYTSLNDKQILVLLSCQNKDSVGIVANRIISQIPSSGFKTSYEITELMTN